MHEVTMNALSTFEMMLLGAMGTGLMGIGTLITWTFKSVVPRIMATLEERTKALVTAVEKIPEALDKFEGRLAEAETKIIARIEERRFDDLKEEIRRRLPSEDTIPPVTVRKRG
jgi:uncharacterized protein Yka (UPF0111/DUF47 family)